MVNVRRRNNIFCVIRESLLDKWVASMYLFKRDMMVAFRKMGVFMTDTGKVCCMFVRAMEAFVV